MDRSIFVKDTHTAEKPVSPLLGALSWCVCAGCFPLVFTKSFANKQLCFISVPWNHSHCSLHAFALLSWSSMTLSTRWMLAQTGTTPPLSTNRSMKFANSFNCENSGSPISFQTYLKVFMGLQIVILGINGHI